MSSAWSTGPSTRRWKAESRRPSIACSTPSTLEPSGTACGTPRDQRRGDPVVAVGDVVARGAQLGDEVVGRRSVGDPPHALKASSRAGELEQGSGRDRGLDRPPVDGPASCSRATSAGASSVVATCATRLWTRWSCTAS